MNFKMSSQVIRAGGAIVTIRALIRSFIRVNSFMSFQMRRAVGFIGATGESTVVHAITV